MPQPAHHTSIGRGTYSSDRGTPHSVLNVVRVAFGPITVDLCSSQEHNKRVQARKIWTATNPCPTTPRVGRKAVVWCNPPGPCASVREFWDAWLHCVMRYGARGGFLLFNLDHWRQIHAPPVDLPCVVLRKRVQYVGTSGTATFPSTLVLSPRTGPLDWLWDLDVGHVVTWRAGPTVEVAAR